MGLEGHLYKVFLSDRTSFRVMYMPWAYFLKNTIYMCVFPLAISLMQEELQQVNNTGALRDVGDGARREKMNSIQLWIFLLIIANTFIFTKILVKTIK